MRDPTAVLGRRFLALVVDVLIVLVVTGLLAPDALEAGVARGVNLCPPGEGVLTEEPAAADGQICTRGGRLITYDGRDSNYVEFGGVVGWILVFSLVTAAIYVLEGATGRTPGKALVGIATVTADGTPAGVGRGLLRWLVSIVDWIPYACGPVVGGVIVLATDDHRRLADYAAGTYVVHKSAMGTPLALLKGQAGSAQPSQSPTSHPTSTAYPTSAEYPTSAPPSSSPGSPVGGWGQGPGWGAGGGPAQGAAWDQGAATFQGGAGTPPDSGAADTAPPLRQQPVPPTAVPSGPAPSPPPGFMAPQWDPRWVAWLAWNTGESRWYRYDPSSGNWIPL
ncbi:MAG: hypothetical protein KatS3mg008_2167 [Acidimicrobiales bacterium]|nr:MAG: hypothetical protein KatS3mg008_2167 [Acidimicrobiales bacterium]